MVTGGAEEDTAAQMDACWACRHDGAAPGSRLGLMEGTGSHEQSRPCPPPRAGPRGTQAFGNWAAMAAPWAVLKPRRAPTLPQASCGPPEGPQNHAQEEELFLPGCESRPAHSPAPLGAGGGVTPEHSVCVCSPPTGLRRTQTSQSSLPCPHPSPTASLWSP